MDSLFALVIMACTVLDVYSTKSLVTKLGTQIELHQPTRWLVEVLGLVPGLIVGVGGVSVLVTSLLLALESTLALSFFAGVKVMLGYMQIARYQKLGF